MSATSKPGTVVPRLMAVALPLLLAGCTSAFSGPDGMRVVVRPNTIYVVMPGPVEVRAMCVAAGMQAPGPDRRMLAEGGEPTLSDAAAVATAGCQGQMRSVIVCADGDERCLRHEERHAREGAFHQ